jgi:hypothetical protein
MRQLRVLTRQSACCGKVDLIHHPSIRTLYSSNRLYDIRFPHGVPAFPISPPKQYKTRPLPAYRDVRPNTTRNIIVFLSICGAWTVAAMMAINYERFASPVTASTLHEVRKSPKARELLGKDIQHRCMHPAYKGWYRYDGWFRQPWISGSIQLTKGTIDVAYDVKGSGNLYAENSLTCRCRRKGPLCQYKT